VRTEVVHAGLAFPEGLAWSERDGVMIVTITQGGDVYRLDPGEPGLEHIADLAGGANNTTLATDGSIIVAQNGGIAAGRMTDDARPPIRPAPPGLQCIRPDGHVTYLVSDGLNAPNDVVAHKDGSIYFTDPGRPRQGPDYTGGRVMRLDSTRGLSVLTDGLFYPNGIAIDDDDNLLITERNGLLRITPDGRRTWVVETLTDHGGDGLCIDEMGSYFVSMRARGGRAEDRS